MHAAVRHASCPLMHTEWQPAQLGSNNQLSKKGVQGCNPPSLLTVRSRVCSSPVARHASHRAGPQCRFSNLK